MEAKNDDKISTLRVAQSELVSGDTTGQVFRRLSPGAVAFAVDRKETQAKFSSQLRQAVLQEQDG